jgi:hypothetical protein
MSCRCRGPGPHSFRTLWQPRSRPAALHEHCHAKPATRQQLRRQRHLVIAQVSFFCPSLYLGFPPQRASLTERRFLLLLSLHSPLRLHCGRWHHRASAVVCCPGFCGCPSGMDTGPDSWTGFRCTLLYLYCCHHPDNDIALHGVMFSQPCPVKAQWDLVLTFIFQN